MQEWPILQGKVQKGQNRGKRLGFPTINFSITKHIPDGIYLSTITLKGATYNALTFIGAAKTFNETTYHAETYILDFNDDVYGEDVSVSLIKKIRDNQKFDSEDALISQMQKDKEQAEKYFTS